MQVGGRHLEEDGQCAPDCPLRPLGGDCRETVVQQREGTVLPFYHNIDEPEPVGVVARVELAVFDLPHAKGLPEQEVAQVRHCLRELFVGVLYQECQLLWGDRVVGVFDEFLEFCLAEEGEHGAPGSAFDVFSLDVLEVAHEAVALVGEGGGVARALLHYLN
jgi:hypothetical protein